MNYLSPIETNVLKLIYKNACTSHCLTNNNTLSKNVYQCFFATEIYKELSSSQTDIDYDTVDECLNKLEEQHFITQVENHPINGTAYAITEAGIKALTLK